MPIVGIDFGTESCTVALALRGGIDIVLNEFSKRSTPSVVGFTDKEREIGEAAANNITFNARNTIPNVKRVLGLKFSQIPKDDLAEIPCKIVADADDNPFFVVNAGDKELKFSPVQVLAMLFTKMKKITEEKANAKGVEAVITVPTYFTDRQRRDVIHAADIAGVRCLSLINDVTAAAIEYAIYRNFDETNPTHVAFVDIGHAASKVSIMAITKGKVKVLASAHERNLGARNFDRFLTEHLIVEIKNKYKLDVNTNAKAKSRLEREADRMKKMLSINPVVQLRLECFMNDKDISLELNRDTFEKLSEPLLPLFADVLNKVVAESKLALNQINSVELIGGGSYIPCLKKAVAQAFNQQVFTTLNAADSVARGAALHAALTTPYFRMAKDCKVIEGVHYPVNSGYKNAAAMEIDSEPEQIPTTPIFKAGEGVPNNKILTFQRSTNFDIYLLYSDANMLVAGSNTLLGRYSITKVPNKNSKIKVRVKHNNSGILEVDEATLIEETEVLEEVKPEPAPAATKPADAPKEQPAADAAPAADATPAAEPKKEFKKVLKTISSSLPVVAHVPGELTVEQVKALAAEEAKLTAHDDLIAATAEAKNTLESSVYAFREKMDTIYEKYMDSNSKQNFLNALDEAESWLYGEGEDTTKDAYVNKLGGLLSFSMQAERRKSESEQRPAALTQLMSALDTFRNFVASTDAKYAHIVAEDRAKVAAECDRVQFWLSQEMQKQSALAENQDPIVTVASLQAKVKELNNTCNPIMNKPAPKKEEPKKEEPKKEEPKNTTTEQPKQQDEKKEDKMDVD